MFKKGWSVGLKGWKENIGRFDPALMRDPKVWMDQTSATWLELIVDDEEKRLGNLVLPYIAKIYEGEAIGGWSTVDKKALTWKSMVELFEAKWLTKATVSLMSEFMRAKQKDDESVSD